VFLNNLNFAPLPLRVFLSNLDMKCSQVSHAHEIPKLVSKDLQFNYPFNNWKVFEFFFFFIFNTMSFKNKTIGASFQKKKI
jgi:hypothetical protein